CEVSPSVAVVIGGHRDVAGITPLRRRSLAAGGTVDHPPLAVGRPPEGEVGFPIAVVISGYGDVAALAPDWNGNGDSRPPHSVNVTSGAVDDPPLASPRPPNCEIGPPVAVVIGGHRNVAGIAPPPWEHSLAAGGTVDHPPHAVARPPEADISQFVSVVVAGYRD